MEYIPPEKFNGSPRKWLDQEKNRLSTLGLESGQKFIFDFDRDPRKDWVENLGRFERPVK